MPGADVRQVSDPTKGAGTGFDAFHLGFGDYFKCALNQFHYMKVKRELTPFSLPPLGRRLQWLRAQTSRLKDSLFSTGQLGCLTLSLLCPPPPAADWATDSAHAHPNLRTAHFTLPLLICTVIVHNTPLLVILSLFILNIGNCSF